MRGAGRFRRVTANTRDLSEQFAENDEGQPGTARCEDRGLGRHGGQGMLELGFGAGRMRRWVGWSGRSAAGETRPGPSRPGTADNGPCRVGRVCCRGQTPRAAPRRPADHTSSRRSQHRQAQPGVFRGRRPQFIGQPDRVVVQLLKRRPGQLGPGFGHRAAVDRFGPGPQATAASVAKERAGLAIDALALAFGRPIAIPVPLRLVDTISRRDWRAVRPFPP